MAFSPIISSSRLAVDKIVRPEDLSIGTTPDAVHSPRLKVHEDCPGDILGPGSLIEVHIDALQLQVRVSLVGAGGVDAVLVRDDLPELGSDLVSALAGLKMDDFSHFWTWLGMV